MKVSQKESSTVLRLLSLSAILAVLLIFAVILYVAYLPGRPAPVDQEVSEKRKIAADDTRAAGLAKISEYKVDDTTKVISIPIEAAMDLTVSEYRTTEKISN